VSIFAAETEEPFLFVSVRPTGFDRQWYSVIQLPHASGFYGGWKDDRLVNVSDVRRSLSSADLDYEVGTFQIELSDDDYAIRGYLRDAQGRFFSRWEVDAYIATPSGMSLGTAVHIGTGRVDSDPRFDVQEEGLSVQLTCRDRIGAAMRWTDVGQSQIPRRVLSPVTLPGVSETARGMHAPIPWGVLTTASVIPSGFTPPTPSGLAARGAFVTGTFWTAGWAPWSPTPPPPVSLTLTAESGGDCPERDFAVQVFPVDASDNVGDPFPFVMGDELVTPVSPNLTVRAEWPASSGAAKYYVVLAANFFGWRAQQVIETTGLFAEFNHAFDPPDFGTGYADGAVGIEQRGNFYTARSKNGSIRSNWHDVEDPVNTPQQFGITFTLPNGRTRPQRVAWVPVGADSYEVKKGSLIFNVPSGQMESGLVYFDDDFNDAEGVGESELLDRPQGRVKLFHTRNVPLPDGNTWKEFLIGGCPVQGTDDWFYDPGGDVTAVEVSEGDGTEWLFPREGTAWESVFGTARYRDVVGGDGVSRRYTFAYGLGPKADLVASGISILTVNLRGVEDQGDSDGDVLTDLHDQFLHLLNYFIVASGEGYTSGLWGPVPRQSYSDFTVVNEDSFADLKAMRNSEIEDGVIGAGITGAGGQPVDVSEEIKRWCVCGDFRLGPNMDWRLTVCAINESLSASGVTAVVTDEFDIQLRTFVPQLRLQELHNAWDYRYQRDYVDIGRWRVDNQEFIDQDSIDDWDMKRNGDLSFSYLDDPAVASFILGKHRRRRRNAPGYVQFEGDLNMMDVGFDLGETFRLKHYRGLAPSGWREADNQTFWILSHTYIPTKCRVQIEAMDITDLIGD
jgi:hypothetical protein